MHEEIEQLKHELDQIRDRNRQVEADKAWETSRFRVGALCVITYIVASLVMKAIGVHQPLTNALIPTLGYFLSTQSLPMIKRWWIASRRK